ncbi:MAG: hypothetical protein GC178_00160 [Flavobacteriales bacterium]|nr:hypothetical protein [Flavobacteriales bacterium]
MKLTATILFALSLFVSDVRNEPTANDQQSYTDCVVKYRSNWGEDCSQCVKWNDSYVVYLKNTCTEAIDVMVCVQESNKEWRRFQHSGMASGDSLRAYACEGTGKYMAWGRRAGDESVTFPTIEEVNKMYSD